MSVSLIDGHIDREKQTMTDNEIIKALSDLVKSTERIKHGGTKKVIVGAELLKDILNFINGKDEQIESLIAGQATLQKFIAEKDKEFEKIQKENTELDGANILLTVTLQNAKSEAVKEFAESVTYCKDCVVQARHKCKEGTYDIK